MARKKKKQKQRIFLYHDATQLKDGKLVFMPVTGSKVIVEYPDDYPSDIKRRIGIIKFVNEQTCNVCLWADQEYQYFGTNYRTAPNRGIKILVEDIIDNDE